MKNNRAKFKSYFNDLGKKTASPGGGSAVCVIFSLGVALIEMAMQYSLKKKRNDIDRLKELRAKVYPLIDLDGEIFSKIMKAKSPDRAALIGEGEKLIIDLGKSAHKAFKISAPRHGEIKRCIISDFDVGLDCLKITLKGCIANLEGNAVMFGKKSKYIETFKNILKQWRKY
ncbi:MAG: cyclodeaminase/cyclohydrolase family protein [Candidatus Omnitrophica bacterium]|nr:cyclodeaminase/cyclohydrolase family protein [Candidatus Omnitrophota bacterium]